MAKIKFNSSAVVGAQKYVNSAKSTSSSVKSGVDLIRKNMQSDVAARSNISTRLNSLKSSMSTIESNLGAICKVVDSATTKYRTTETEVLRLGLVVARGDKTTSKNSKNNGAFAPIKADKSKVNSKPSKKEDVKWGKLIISNGADLLKKMIGKVGFIGSAVEVVADFSKGVSEKSKYKMGKAITKGGKSVSTLIGDLASNAYKPSKQQDWKKAFIGDWSTHSLLKNLDKTATPLQKIKTGGVKWMKALKKEKMSFSMKNAETVGDKIKVGTKWAGVALSAISNGIGNVEEHGELNGRAIAETIGETVADVAIGAAATATVVGVAAAIGASAPAVLVGAISVGVVWVTDKIVKATTGKRSASELISDAVLDVGETIIGGAKTVFNEIGDAIGNIGVKWKSCFA